MFESTTFAPTLNKSRSLYIHIPFCRHRCGYCNFALLADRDELIDRYLDALAIEIGWLKNRPMVSTIFLGGGTPSRLSGVQLERLFDLIATAFEVVSDAEITIECNPGDIGDAYCRALQDVGVNRISLGVQSFNESKLKFLERDHSRGQIESAVGDINRYFKNVSFDLIFAVEHEELEDWIVDLQHAIALQPDHLSTYELTIEKGTQFWNSQHHGSLTVPDEEQRADLYEATIENLAAEGYGQYEISSFSRPGFRCRHNSTYWDGSDYLAFGTSAARYVDGIRETNHRSTTTYLKRVTGGESPAFESELITPFNRKLEKLAFGLRQMDGIDVAAIRSEADFLPTKNDDQFDKHLQRLESLELLVQLKPGIYVLTRRGLLLYDSIATEILSLPDLESG